uniref:SH3b domain-containing protein n=1 Tax=Parastrongyloides trichosuri TaxID=131310 RepID=A0A0N5A047_PARTI
MTISSINLTARMLLILWMVATVGCSLFPSAPSGVTNKNISYELRHNSPSDVIMVKCPGSNFKYGTLPGNFVYNINLIDKAGFKEFDDKKYAWMAWKKEDISASNLNVQCGYYDYKVAGTVNFNKLFWNIKIISTSTTKFLKSVDLLPTSDIVGNPMRGIDRCGKPNNELKIILKDKNGKLSNVEKIQFDVLQSKKIFYFFDESKIVENTELLSPCGIADVYLASPTISIVGYKLVKIAKNNRIKITYPVEMGEKKYFFKLVIEGSQDLTNFYQGEKVLIQRMLYRNGKVELKQEKGIEASESFLVTGYEILEISYKSLTKDRKYEDVREIIFFGPVNKNLELKMEIIKITAADVPYQLSCSYTKFDYAYLYQIKTDKEVIDVERLTTDGAVVGDFSRSGDLVKYKPVDVNTMNWVCIYKTPNGKVIVPYILVRGDRYYVKDNGNGDIVVTQINETVSNSKPSFFYGLVMIVVLIVLLIFLLILFLVYRRKIKHFPVVVKKGWKNPIT